MTTSWPPLLERALRFAAHAHRNQTRKASELPYITHPVAVALILQQHQHDDDTTLAAALLHDVVEDTTVTARELANQFPPEVCQLVGFLTECKQDQSGRKRPWKHRKLEHIDQIATAPIAARAIALADKLHNLSTMAFDVDAGQDLSGRFNASLDRLFEYYQSMIITAAGDEDSLSSLRKAAASALEAVRQCVPNEGSADS